MIERGGNASKEEVMMKKQLPLPPWQDYEYGYTSALEVVAKQLANIKDVEQLCRKSGAQYQLVDSEKRVLLTYLNQPFQVTFPEIEVTRVNSQRKVVSRDKVLILHYLYLAKGIPLSNKTISYRDLPDGNIYLPSFTKRAIKPLIDKFGDSYEKLIELSKRLGGHQAKYGDVSVAIKAFPNVPVIFVLWRGDEEFPTDANILFDSSVSAYLYPEDINVLCQTITWKLITWLKS